MHSEPVDTTADLIHAGVISISSEIQEAYHRILSNFRNLVLHAERKSRTVELVEFALPDLDSAVQSKIFLG